MSTTAELDTRPEILIVCNAPGELAAWVRPVLARLQDELGDARVVVALVPCPYASGREADTLRGWGHLGEVWSPMATMKAIATGRQPGGSGRADRGVVLFLGGDQAFAALLAKRFGHPLLVYTDGAARWPQMVHRYLVGDRNTFLSLRNRRHPAEALRLVGNLMVDAVQTQYDPIQTRRALGLRPDAPVVGLLPGSKPFKLKYVTPLLLRVAEVLQARHPGLQVVLHRSPFTRREELVEAVESEAYRRVTDGASGRLEREGTVDWIITPGGARVQVIPPELQYDGMSVADLAVTVPGTNTAELAILGVPMVVALPLHRPEEIPLDGLIGYVRRVPFAGPAVMRGIAKRLVARRPLVALPNQRAGQMIAPEVMGAFTPEHLAKVVNDLLEDGVRRRDMRMQLRGLMGGPGAASAVVAAIAEALGERRTLRDMPPAWSEPHTDGPPGERF